MNAKKFRIVILYWQRQTILFCYLKHQILFSPNYSGVMPNDFEDKIKNGRHKYLSNCLSLITFSCSCVLSSNTCAFSILRSSALQRISSSHGRTTCLTYEFVQQLMNGKSCRLCNDIFFDNRDMPKLCRQFSVRRSLETISFCDFVTIKYIFSLPFLLQKE